MCRTEATTGQTLQHAWLTCKCQWEQATAKTTCCTLRTPCRCKHVPWLSSPTAHSLLIPQEHGTPQQQLVLLLPLCASLHQRKSQQVFVRLAAASRFGLRKRLGTDGRTRAHLAPCKTLVCCSDLGLVPSMRLEQLLSPFLATWFKQDPANSCTCSSRSHLTTTVIVLPDLLATQADSLLATSGAAGLSDLTLGRFDV